MNSTRLTDLSSDLLTYLHTLLQKSNSFQVSCKILNSKIQQSLSMLKYEYSYQNTKKIVGIKAAVLSAIVLENGLLVSGSSDGNIRIWKGENNSYKQMILLTGHEDSVYSLCEIGCGDFASGSSDKKVIVWRTRNESFFPNQVLSGHSETINSLLQLKNTNLISCGDDALIKMWKSVGEEFSLLHSFNIHSQQVNKIIEVSESKFISVSYDKTLVEWENFMNSYNSTVKLKELKAAITAISAIGYNRIASGNAEGSVCIYNLADYKPLQKLKGHKDIVNSIIQLKDGCLVTSSCDRTVRVWEKSGSLFSKSITLIGHIMTVHNCLEVEKDQLLSISSDKRMFLWKRTLQYIFTPFPTGK